MEYVIYCDESDEKGEYYSNFYGGLLIRSKDLDHVKKALAEKKNELNLLRELKWQRVTSEYLEKYVQFTELLLSYVERDIIKIRIMFTQNIYLPQNYGGYHKENKYFLLYYQFIKHAFGFRYSPKLQVGAKIRLYLDKMPDTKEKVELFKNHIQSLNKNPNLKKAGIIFDKEQMAEIDSKEHVLAQSLDIILGAIQFRLNDKHLFKPEGAKRRGKRTIAKEKLYKYINKRIREIYPNFNVGVNTSDRGDLQNRWDDPYRHWLFVANGSSVDLTRGKRK